MGHAKPYRAPISRSISLRKRIASSAKTRSVSFARPRARVSSSALVDVDVDVRDGAMMALCMSVRRLVRAASELANDDDDAESESSLQVRSPSPLSPPSPSSPTPLLLSFSSLRQPVTVEVAVAI